MINYISALLTMMIAMMKDELFGIGLIVGSIQRSRGKSTGRLSRVILMRSSMHLVLTQTKHGFL